MTRQEMAGWLKDHGYKDNGHNSERFVKETENGRRCFKINALAVRYETEIVGQDSWTGKTTRRWVRLRSGYLGKLQVGTDGRLQGLKV